jgi:hypothetical protein
MAEANGPSASGDWTPRPDPTLLTTEALNREVNALREVFVTRLDGYDKAIAILQVATNRSPTPGEINLDLSNFKDLVVEKFNGVTERFKGISDSIQQRDVRLGQAEQAAKDAVTTAFTGSEKAVASAFAAAKEAVGAQSDSFDKAVTKAELATTKLLDALNVQIATSANGLDDKIDDLKALINKLDSRLTTLESRGVVGRETQTQSNWSTSTLIGVMALAISFVGLIVVLWKVG